MESTIKLINQVKEWSNPNGTVYYHQLELENGDKIEIGKKSYLKVGDSIEYEFTGVDDGQQEFKKAKTPKKDFTPGVTAPKSSNDLKGIKIGHAITNAVSLYCACDGNMGDQMDKIIKDYAKMIYEISEELNNEL